MALRLEIMSAVEVYAAFSTYSSGYENRVHLALALLPLRLQRVPICNLAVVNPLFHFFGNVAIYGKDLPEALFAFDNGTCVTSCFLVHFFHVDHDYAFAR